MSRDRYKLFLSAREPFSDSIGGAAGAAYASCRWSSCAPDTIYRRNSTCVSKLILLIVLSGLAVRTGAGSDFNPGMLVCLRTALPVLPAWSSSVT